MNKSDVSLGAHAGQELWKVTLEPAFESGDKGPESLVACGCACRCPLVVGVVTGVSYLGWAARTGLPSQESGSIQ